MQRNFRLKYRVFILAIIIGLMTGLVGIAFKFVLLEGFSLISTHATQPFVYVLLPFSLIFVMATLRQYGLDKENQGFGVSQVMFEIEYIKTRMMNPMSVFFKTIGTIITLLSGYSVGIHGPITHIGGAIGSSTAHFFKMSNDETRVLIGCGVAGCMAAAFHAPIFATLFVVEVIFKKRFFDMIGTILLGAISGYFVAWTIKPEPYLDIHTIATVFQIKYIPHFILLGLIMGLMSALYVLSLEKTKKYFDKIFKNKFIKAAVGASSISLFYFVVGKNFTYGINIQELVERVYPQERWFLLAFTILLLTTITLASGGMGGLFAPGLYIGFSSGLGISSFHMMGYTNPITIGLISMAAMFSGFAIAPLTATFMIIEFTEQYHLVIPTLIATLAASTFSEFTLKQSIYHNNLSQLIKVQESTR